MTSSDPNTVTVTALNTHDNPRTAPFVLGTLHMKKTLKLDSIIAPAILYMDIILVITTHN